MRKGNGTIGPTRQPSETKRMNPLACLWITWQARQCRALHFAALLFCTTVASQQPNANRPGGDAQEARPGGDTTLATQGRQAFSFPAANLDAESRANFDSGSLIFRRDWFAAPRSYTAGNTAGNTAVGLGLGPHFNERSCSGCHSLDGRGAPHAAGDMHRRFIPVQPFALVFRLAVPGANGKPQPEPRYGRQFSNSAVPGVRPEGAIHIRYAEKPGRFDDGTAYSLRQPHYHFSQLAYGPLDAQTMVSPRIAPHLPGVGLLDAISEGDIEQNARDQARRPDAIKGIVSRVFDPFGGEVVGRFGWKASTGSLQHQTAAAFQADMGITSEHFAREDCMPAQLDCLRAQRNKGATGDTGGNGVNGGKADKGGSLAEVSPVEIDNDTFGKVVAYQATLAVPARRDMDNLDVRRGQALFAQAQCSACHRPAYTTAKGYGPALSRQRIYPYTDLLLHDMGLNLADRRANGSRGASGSQGTVGAGGLANLWRTPPLWGIGLIPEVNGHSFLLHDGRARGVLEAILWHGGEAMGSRQKVLAMTASEREVLVKFVNSL